MIEDKINLCIDDDDLYRPKKQNNRKHTLPLFVYLILKEHSDPTKRLSQNDIINILLNEYEITVERKSLSRTIHDLEDEHLGIFSNKNDGTWYDENGYLYELSPKS